MTRFSKTHCDIGEHFRAWMLAIPEVKKWVHGNDAVVDTIDESGCPPLIWYSRSGSKPSDTLNNCGGGIEQVNFELEIIAAERLLSETRGIAEILRQAADDHQRRDPFGADDFKIQLIEIMDVDDRYVPKAYSLDFSEGICVTAMAVEITPMFGVARASSSSSSSSSSS